MNGFLAPRLAALGLQAPAALGVLALGVPLVLLHLYRRRRVTVAFLGLFTEARGPRRAGAGFQRVRERVSLAARLAALALLALALAGLAPRGTRAPEEALVLVLDGDATVQAREGDGRTRWEHEVDLASAWVGSRPWRAVAVVEAAGAPRTLAPPGPPEAARARLARVTGPESAGRGDLEAALDDARRAARRLAPARVLALTARPLDVPPDEPGVSFSALGAGATRREQGFVSLDVLRADDGVRRRLRARVRNEDDAPARRDLVVRLGDAEVERRVLDLAPGATEVVDVVVLPPRGGAYARLELEGGDAYPDDDRVVAWLAPPARPSVLVVHAGAVRPYTRAVLEAMGDGLDLARSGTVDVQDLARADLADVTIVDGVALPDGALRPGAWLFLAPLAGALPFEVGVPVDDPLVWRTAPDHPLVRDIDLGSAWIARADPVSGPGVVALAEADGRAVLAEGERDRVRYVVLGLRPEASDLPVRAAFPLLVRNAIRRLARGPVELLPSFLVPGEALVPRAPLPGAGPAGVAEATVAWDGASEGARLAPDAADWRVPAGARGEVRVSTASGLAARTAFVDVDPGRRIAPVRPPAVAPAAAAPVPDDLVRWRRALVTLALLLLLADVALVVAARAGARAPGLPSVREELAPPARVA